MLDHYMENTGLFCDARTVPESQIEQVLVAAINQAWCGKDTFLATLQKTSRLSSVKGTVRHSPMSTSGWQNCKRSF